jgi:chromosome segregation ATPase
MISGHYNYEEKLGLSAKVEMLSENLRMLKESSTELESNYKALKGKHENIEKDQRAAEEASKASQAERDAALKEAAELRGRIASLQEQNERVLAMLGPSTETT